MAERLTLKEVLDNGTTIVDSNLFIVDTLHDGYFNIAEGSLAYLVIAEDVNNLAVHPVRARLNNETGEATFNKAEARRNNPVIRVIDGDVFFVANTRIDPYNTSVAFKVEQGANVNEKLIDAFIAFAYDNFNYGERPYYQYYTGIKLETSGATVIDDESKAIHDIKEIPTLAGEQAGASYRTYSGKIKKEENATVEVETAGEEGTVDPDTTDTGSAETPTTEEAPQ